MKTVNVNLQYICTYVHLHINARYPQEHVHTTIHKNYIKAFTTLKKSVYSKPARLDINPMRKHHDRNKQVWAQRPSKVVKLINLILRKVLSLSIHHRIRN